MVYAFCAFQHDDAEGRTGVLVLPMRATSW